MKNFRPMAMVIVVVALIGVLWFLYAKTQTADFMRQDGSIAGLRELEALDAEWTVDSLRAKTGINRDYARGQAPAERALEATAKLRASVSTLGMPISTERVNELSAVVAQKKRVAERFAEQNRILKESLRFVTDESAEFLARLRELQRDATPRSRAPDAATAETLSTLGLRINDLLTETLKYNLLSDVGAPPRIEAGLADLAAKAASYPTAIAPTVLALSEKFRRVRDQRSVEDAILNEIAALPMRQRIAALEAAIEDEKKQITDSTDFYRALLILFSAALLGVMGWLAGRLIQSYKLIQRTNAELASVNGSLEQRVCERTVELAAALQHLKDSESALIQSGKLSSLGQIVAGVAHEINTPLAYVRTGLEVLDEQLSRTAEVVVETRTLLALLSATEPSADLISTQFARVDGLCQSAQQSHGVDELSSLIKDGLYGIDQISEIVGNLKNFSRIDRDRVSRFDLNEGLESTLVIAKCLVKTKTIHKQFARDAHITGSPSQINQVFLNLISNAAQATGEDGVITLRTGRDGSHLRVEVEDNGSGIAAEVLPKIFDPFFTTKKVGEGTGLGLSIAYKIVADHGGRIEVDSTLGRGTRFTITLPAEVIPANLESTVAMAA